MSIAIGSRLGPYEILSTLGSGGMGEVWRARDTRLERDVAIKVLPQDFASSDEHRARFEREARTISSLNHPHICTLHDVGEHDGSSYLVLELLEGESLAGRLEKGAMPMSEVMRVGEQIASALDAAHRRGIVHRDLKPANIMLTRSGAKLLDFGLAKDGADGGGPLDTLTHLETEARPLTQHGTVLGTFQYMAPEQLEGQPADTRTDIFGLGAVLYEMATGRRAFQGETKTSLIAAIVSQDPPPMSDLAPMTPPAFDHLVRRCLAKDPDERWQSAHDVAGQLRFLRDAGSRIGEAPVVAAARRHHRQWLVAAAVLGWLAAAGLGIWSLTRGPADDARPALRAELLPDPGFAIGGVVTGAVALSPDGRRMAFQGGRDTRSALAIRELDTGTHRVLDGTDGAMFPFWSPDGGRLGFFADGRLKTVSAEGGPIQIVADALEGRGGTWGPDGDIVFAPDIRGPLFRVDSNGGTPTTLTNPASEYVTHRNPWFLADGRTVLFTARDSQTRPVADIYLVSIDDGTERLVVEHGTNPQVANGFLFTVRDGNLVAQRFDADALAVKGPVIAVTDRIEEWNPRDVGNFSVSSADLLVYRHARLRRSQVVWLDREGRERQTVGSPDHFLNAAARLSTDRRSVLLIRQDVTGGHRDAWRLDIARGQLTRSTFVATTGAMSAVLSADGNSIAVAGLAGSSSGWAASSLWTQSISGSGQREVLIEGESCSVSDWSRDGRWVLASIQRPDTRFDLAVVDLEGERRPIDLLASPFDERNPRLSPDGRWLAYDSNETGRVEVYLTDFPDARQKWQVSIGGGNNQLWSEDGGELLWDGSEGLVAATISGTDEPIIGEPVVLIGADDPVRDSLSGPIIAATLDRLLALRHADDVGDEPLRLISNWRLMMTP